MQTLTLDLPTPVLLVWGLPEDAELIEVRPHQIRNAVHEEDCYAVFSGDTYLFRSPFKIAFIGKLSELTEEEAKGLVENIEIPFAPDEICYPYYNMTGFRGLDSALESFRSAILNEGYYVINPFQPPIESDYMPDVNFTKEQEQEYWKDYKKYESAQSKTLPANTLIFKRV